jgi:hypothetical protein
MGAMIRALAFIVILFFAASTVAHAVQASSMSAEMVMTADGAMPGCDECNDDDAASKLACMQVCVAPAVAILGSDTPVVVNGSGYLIPLAASESDSRVTFADPYPPRSRVLT